MKWLKFPGLWIEIKEDKVKQRQYLSFSQRVQIYNFIKTMGKVNGEHWEYNEGWSDQRVAEQFKVSHGNVATVRSELGKLRTYTGAPFAKKIAELEAKVERLEKALANDIALYNAHTDKVNDINRKVADLEAKFSRLRLKEHFQA
jgi:phage host-nuclease inhibitor protein Gam